MNLAYHANGDAYTHKNKHTHTDRCTNRQTLYASLRVTQRKEEKKKKKKKKKKKRRKQKREGLS